MTSAGLWQPAQRHDLFTKPIQRSPNDDRDYRLIRLHNGLHALLVHDSKVDKAAASLAVTVGHLSDPDDMPGMAHFCEHLLFMGTDQFPRENEYGDYIAAHGGRTNAYTASSDTNYYFCVGADHLPGALERFSGFFHCPLFAPTCTSRELHAVDSEHKKNLQNDSWRTFQMSKFLSRPGHVWAKFGSGNMLSLTAAAKAAVNQDRPAVVAEGMLGDSLAASTNGTPLTSRVPSPVPSFSSESEADGGSIGRETRRRLVEWWENHYCASRMNLVIIGKESLDELTTLAVDNFSPILNRSLPPVKPVPELPWGPDQAGTIILAKTIMDFQLVEFQFQLKPQNYHFRTKPAHYIAHLIGHEGPGSLHSYLKQKGLIIRLSCGNQPQARGIDFFKISCFLTPAGFKRYQEVVLAVCKYLNILRSTEKFPEHLWHETQILAETRFNYAEKRASDSYASALSEIMSKPYPPELLLSAGSLLWDWDETLVRRTLAEIVPENSRILLMARDFAVAGLEPPQWDAERWYKTQYHVQRMDDAFLTASRQPNDLQELFLPPQNDFIPDDLSVEKLEVEKPEPCPTLVRKTPLATLWHKKDDQFWVPKANVILYLRTPLAGLTPRHSVLTRLFCELVSDALSEYAYAAELASLRYTISPDVYGIQILLSGYNDKLHILLSTVLKKVKNLDISISRLQDIKEDVRQEYVNFAMSQPVELADYYLRYALAHVMWMPAERLEELSSITVEDLQHHITGLLSRVNIDALVHGNVTQERSISILDETEATLAARPLSESEIASNRSFILPAGANFVWRQDVPNKENVNSGISYYLHVGDLADDALRAKLSLVAHLIHEPTFDILRTKEQLGYIAQSIMLTRTGIMGLRVHIQSERNPTYLEQRVEAFLEGFKGYLEAMTEEDYEKQKRGLITKKLEKAKSLSEEGNRIWGAINSGYNDFTRREIDAEYVRNIPQKEVIEFIGQYLLPTSPDRRKLSIHMRGRPKVEPRVSIEAANILLAFLKLQGIPIDEVAYKAGTALEPPVEAFKNHWTQVFASMPDVSAETAKAVQEEIDRVVGAHPVTVIEETPGLPEGATEITSLADFKAHLALSPAATDLSGRRH